MALADSSKAAFVIVSLSLLAAGCSDDSDPTPETDQKVQGDLALADTTSPFDGGGVDRYVPTGDGAPQPTDGGGPDSHIPPPAKCSATATVVLQEIATGQPDYLSVKNTGGSPVSLANFQLVMNGINVEFYTFQAGTSVDAGKVLYIFEYSSNGQPGDVNTGGNIPFYDDLSSNAVALYDGAGNLLDFIAIGDKIVGKPSGANVTLFPWPTGYDASTQSVQRVAQAGECPNFKASDWAATAMTRPPTSP